MHDEITHQALGPVFIMYEYRFILVSSSGKPENWGEAQHLSATGRGMAEVSGVGGAGSSIAQQRPGPFALWALKLVC